MERQHNLNGTERKRNDNATERRTVQELKKYRM